MRNPRPRNPLIPALIATSFLDGGAVWVGDEFDADPVAVAVTVVVAETVFVFRGHIDTVAVVVTVVVAETVSVLLGDVEPDVRLKITSPAGTGKGV